MPNPKSTSRQDLQPRNILRFLSVGFLMGTANLVPGVSGGTIALVCGIYERLIFALRTLDRKSLSLFLRGDLRGLWEKVPILFLAALTLGVAVAFLSMAHLLSFLINSYQSFLWAFFTGLIGGSILYIGREVGKWDLAKAALFAASTIMAILLTGPFSIQLPTEAPFLVLGGMIAVAALLLPGLSGSHVLVVIGLYGFILEAFTSLQLQNLALFGSGMVLGVLVFAQAIGALLKKARNAVLAVLTGLMAGSLPAVWPWQKTVTERINSAGEPVPLQQVPVLPSTPPDMTEGSILLLCLVIGIFSVYLLTRLQEKNLPSLQNPQAVKTESAKL
ncbi:MAG: DUF368 domain-containing protein [Opitutales bacterium]|nr:DUF368 domain-containing protein [Opitutales bacterium]